MYSEVAFEDLSQFGARGYRSNCSNVEFDEVIFYSSDRSDEVVFAFSYAGTSSIVLSHSDWDGQEIGVRNFPAPATTHNWYPAAKTSLLPPTPVLPSACPPAHPSSLECWFVRSAPTTSALS